MSEMNDRKAAGWAVATVAMGVAALVFGVVNFVRDPAYVVSWIGLLLVGTWVLIGGIRRLRALRQRDE